MNKKTVIRTMVVLMLLIVAIYFVSGTYSRYASKFTGNATTSVAKWAVKLTGDTTGTKTTIDNLAFTVQSNTNVVPGKIAPGVTAVAEVEVDLTGTEVAVDISAEVTKDAIETVFGESASNVTLTVDVDGQSSTGTTATKTIPLVSSTAFTTSNGKKKLKLTLKWDNKTDTANTSDTTVGKAGKTLTLPVSLTVQQHIDN